MWQMFEWCRESMMEGGEHEAACGASRDEALLGVEALKGMVAEVKAELAAAREGAVAALGAAERDGRRFRRLLTTEGCG